MQRSKIVPLLTLLLALLASRMALFILLPESARSVDLLRFQVVLNELSNGRDPYLTTTYLNYSPLWMWIIQFVGELSELTSLPFLMIFQAAYVLCELLILSFLFFTLEAPQARSPNFRLLLLGYALNPALALLVCQHGHFDVFVGACILIGTVALTQFYQGRSQTQYILAAAVVGVGAMLKSVPILMAPLFGGGLTYLNKRTNFLAGLLVFGPLVCGLTYLGVTAPEGLNKNVLMYASIPGYFGVSGLLEFVGGSVLFPLYKGLFLIVLVCYLTAVLALARSPKVLLADHVLPLTLTTYLIVITLGPGYGPQYFYWIAPLLVLTIARAERKLARLALAVIVVAAITYPIEYAIQPSLGGFLSGYFDNQQLATISSKWFQTTLRLPLFATLLALLVQLVLSLKAVLGDSLRHALKSS